MPIRNSAKAILMKDNKILLTKNKDSEGFFYLFPGGGQEHEETLHEALQRECIEEIGSEIKVGELLHVREYIGKNHEHAAFDHEVHQIEFYFQCKFVYEVDKGQNPSNPDSHQVGIEWIEMNELAHYRIYPKNIIPYLLNNQTQHVYLGDIN